MNKDMEEKRVFRRKKANSWKKNEFAGEKEKDEKRKMGKDMEEK